MNPVWIVTVHLDGLPLHHEQQTNLGYAVSANAGTMVTTVVEKVHATDLTQARVIAMRQVRDRARMLGFPGDVLGTDTPVPVADFEDPADVDPDMVTELPEGPWLRTEIPDMPEPTRSHPLGLTRGDLRAWLDATEHLLDDAVLVLVASDEEGNVKRPLDTIGVQAYRRDGDDVEIVHPDDMEEDEILRVAIVLWP